VFVIDARRVFWTPDAGSSWTDVTGDLPRRDLRSLEFIPGPAQERLVVGTNAGVYASPRSFGKWTQLGTNLPNTSVHDLHYDRSDDILVAGTLGRGVWALPGAGARCESTTSYDSVACRLMEIDYDVRECRAQGLLTGADSLVLQADVPNGSIGMKRRDLRRALRQVQHFRQSVGHRHRSPGIAPSLRNSVRAVTFRVIADIKRLLRGLRRPKP